VTEQTYTGAAWTPEPGAIQFITDPFETGFTDDEIELLLTGGEVTPKSVLADGSLTAAADVQTGAMIAFAPSVEDAMRLAIDGGDPVDELHCTVLYLGDAVDFDDEQQAAIIGAMKEVGAAMVPIVATVFGFAILNPDGPETCLVANVGGGDLDEGFEIIDGIIDETGINIAEQHEPRLAHITLGYDDDPRRWLTDELYTRQGPILLSTLRVAFAGVVTDIPLGQTLTAAAEVATFHLEGKHNQSTHGRGGIAEHASAPEVRAAYTLNEGGTLGGTGAEGEISDGIRGFTGHNGGFNGGTIDPHERSSRGAFVRTVAAAPPTAPKLHRGMTDVPPGKVPREGETFDLGPSSFSSSADVQRW